MRDTLKQLAFFLSLILLAGSLAAFELGMNSIDQKKDRSHDQRFKSDDATDFILSDCFSGSNRYFPAGISDLSIDPVIPVQTDGLSSVHLFSTSRVEVAASVDGPEKIPVLNNAAWRAWQSPSPLLSLMLASPTGEQQASWTAPRFRSALDLLPKR